MKQHVVLWSIFMTFVFQTQAMELADTPEAQKIIYYLGKDTAKVILLDNELDNILFNMPVSAEPKEGHRYSIGFTFAISPASAAINKITARNFDDLTILEIKGLLICFAALLKIEDGQYINVNFLEQGELIERMVPKENDCVRLEFSGSKVISIIGVNPDHKSRPRSISMESARLREAYNLLKKHAKNNAFLQRLQAKKLSFMHVSFNEKEHLFLIKNEQGEYEVPTISSTGNAKEESVQLLRTIFGDLSSLKRPNEWRAEICETPVFRLEVPQVLFEIFRSSFKKARKSGQTLEYLFVSNDILSKLNFRNESHNENNLLFSTDTKLALDIFSDSKWILEPGPTTAVKITDQEDKTSGDS